MFLDEWNIFWQIWKSNIIVILNDKEEYFLFEDKVVGLKFIVTFIFFSTRMVKNHLD